MKEESDAINIAVVSTQIKGLNDLMNAKLTNQDMQLASIKEQTTKTNGHVADAFQKIDDNDKATKVKIDATNLAVENINAFKNKVIGALVITNVIILPVLMYLLYQRLK